MASPLQNRLVGTIILVALAVIILPDVLDGEKADTVEEFETIPLQPEQQTALKQPDPLPEGVKERSRRADPETSEVTATAERAQPLDDAKVQAQGLAAPPREPQEFAADGEAYVIQLGAFSNADSVNELVSQLQQKGFAAYSEPSGKLTKLMVGPDTSKAALEKQLAVLAELTGLQGKVLTYKP